MPIGVIVTSFFAVAFTAGALVLPFVIRKWIDATPLSQLRRLGAALYALFGTIGLTLFAVISTGFLLNGYLGVAASTFWIVFLSQTITIGVNLFFWFSRIAEPSN